jgi:hypothetical protein
VRLRDALQDEQADVELIEYEHAEHNISPPRYRIDMLARVGDFLDSHLGVPPPDFYSGAAAVADTLEIVDFGADTSRPNGICSDARFMAADGHVLRDAAGRVRGTHDDATDCRQLFTSGEIVLVASVAPDHTGNVSAPDRATVFVDPAQQTGVAIVSLDGKSLGGRSGVPVVYARPGYRLVGVRMTERNYACTVRVTGAANAEEPAYVTQPARRDSQVSLVRIPAYAGRYYRIQADVVDDLLLLRVTNATEDRVIVDQRELVAAGCD